MTSNRDDMVSGRRRFLQVGAAGAAGAAALALAPSAVLAKPALKLGPHNLRALARDFDGRLILPGQEGYALAAWPNNARYAGVLPQAVAMCANQKDVQRCIRWAGDSGMPFAIRSGGHNYAGFSTTPGLLIDVKAMNSVTVDLKNETAWVQGGANNNDVAAVLRNYPFAIPSGRCPTVGTSGLVLGGGWGFAATHDGLTCDSLLGTELVLASSEARSINANSHKELFWAVRGGGGGNFGVHTGFTFQLHKVGKVTTFNLSWAPGKQIELLRALQALQLAYPTMISTRSKALPSAAGPRPARDTLYVQTLGQFWGGEKELREMLAPLYAIAVPQTADIYEVDYWRGRDYLLTDDPNGLYDIRCSFVHKELSEAALDNMLNWMTQWPGGSVLQENMGILFAIGGQVKAVRSDATAYVHRDSNFIFEMEASWGPIDTPETVQRQRAWLKDYYNDMQRYLQPESYVNFPNRDLKNWAQAYYGKNLEQLSAVKRHVDPGNLFRFEQSIPLAPKR
ncbi:FAD-binding oxidoreductase [Massilia sp. Root418]|uniref:FAD-binding oxidoreductase n=1 Tax=Massilia sp. Root418 TaxID=1736532 RepID=UPI000A7520FF|nr:FAD-binding oxidoreductase [Massilia sp. Root418]